MFWLLYGVSHYDAANVLVTGSRPRLGKRLRRICTASPCSLLMDWVREALLIERNIHVFLAGVEPRLYGLIVFLNRYCWLQAASVQMIPSAVTVVQIERPSMRMHRDNEKHDEVQTDIGKQFHPSSQT